MGFPGTLFWNFHPKKTFGGKNHDPIGLIFLDELVPPTTSGDVTLRRPANIRIIMPVMFVSRGGGPEGW